MLKGKVALVTGSAKRTGKAIALALAKEGADVVVHYRGSKKDAEKIVAEIKKIGVKAYALQADISNHQEAEGLVKKIIKKSKKIDILVNNVGNFLVKPIDKVTPQEWDELLKTTVTTSFYMCHAALPFMVKQKYGRIVNIADSRADILRAYPEKTAYMIGKTGVLLLTKALAKHYGKYGITVNSVSPGVLENSVTFPKGGLKAVPAGRWATYDDITNAILFLLKKESSYITGANIKVSGGWNV